MQSETGCGTFLWTVGVDNRFGAHRIPFLYRRPFSQSEFVTMAKSRRPRRSSHKARKARRKNPTGTLLVNKGGKRRGPSRKVRRSHKARRSVTLASLLKRVGNPKHSRKAKSHRRSSARRSSHGRARRHNPILTNPGRMLGGMVSKVQGVARRVPLLGGVLGAAFGVVGSVLGGAVGVLPTSYAMPYIAKYVPNWLKPYGYSVAGMLISGVITAIPVKLPYKQQLAIGVAAAGGAVDTYRWRHGKSMDLGDEYSSLLSGDETGDDVGEDGMGNDGSAFAAVEFADANLGDAEFCGEDFSSDEMSAIELGRENYRRRFLRSGEDGEAGSDHSAHAGKPGRRWGWLGFWIGHDNLKKLVALPEGERQAFIAKAKHEARLRARKLLSEGLPTTMAAAETAGLLIAA